jgi:hypothetical protein
VILLIGTGWSLLKPFLNDREKKIIAVVLVLQVCVSERGCEGEALAQCRRQVLDNVALVVLEEMAPGSQEWYTW